MPDGCPAPGATAVTVADRLWALTDSVVAVPALATTRSACPLAAAFWSVPE